jgi:putative transposase
MTYIPMGRGFACLIAGEVISRYCTPEIFNTDQGSQLASEAYTGKLKENNDSIRMNWKGGWGDNVFVEHLWYTIKYEEVYLKAYDAVSGGKQLMKKYINFCNQRCLTPVLRVYHQTRYAITICYKPWQHIHHV